MTTVVNGLLGGIAAASLVGLLAGGLRDGPSLARRIAARALGGDPGAHRWPAFALELAGGGIAGAVLVALELSALDLLAVPPDLAVAVLVGVGWGLALFVPNAALLGALADGERPGADALGRLLVVHLAYGLALGLWIRLTWIT